MTTTRSEGSSAGQEEQRPSDSPGWDASPGLKAQHNRQVSEVTRGPVELVLKLDRPREWKVPEPASGAAVPDVLPSGQRPDELDVDREMTFGDEAWSLGGRLGSRLRDDA